MKIREKDVSWSRASGTHRENEKMSFTTTIWTTNTIEQTLRMKALQEQQQRSTETGSISTACRDGVK
jgi:hypothetical protein